MLAVGNDRRYGILEAFTVYLATRADESIRPSHRFSVVDEDEFKRADNNHVFFNYGWRNGNSILAGEPCEFTQTVSESYRKSHTAPRDG